MRCIAIGLVFAMACADIPHPAPELPHGWKHLDEPVSPDHMIELRLSLKQTNLDQLFEVAQRVSNPQSASYGKYLTGAQLQKLTASRPEHVTAVKRWLKSAGVSFERVSGSCCIFGVSMRATEAESLFATKFRHMNNDKTGQRVVQAGDYSLPDDVDDAMAAVYGMHGFPLPFKVNPVVLEDSKQPAKVTPSVILQTYDVSGVEPSGSDKNRQAVAEFQGQTMKPSDLSSFFKRYVPNAPAGSSTVHKFVPASGTGTAGIEASLDIEYIMGVAPGLLTEFWYWKGMDFCGDLQQWTSTILANDDAPLVHSVSYGWQGELSQLGCKSEKVADVDANFAKLAAKGITIIFASGDSGSGHSASDPIQNVTRKHHQMYPSWPASSPWVTAVGSTRFQDQTVGHAEMATDQFGSGGGFSWMFDAFKDQQTAVANYLKNAPKLPPSGSYPAGGRATPDVAALGEGFQVLASGSVQSVGGTSASTPTFAGLVSLLNEARLKAGKPAMGYLNPWLYQHPEAFTDITVGTNAIGRGGESLGKYGFACTKGWDPATGLGTPIFSKMLSAAMEGAGGRSPLKIEQPLNCKKASYDFCCGVGTPCDCTKGTTSPGQCKPESYLFCCNIGTPCDCSKPPLEGRNTSTIVV